MENKICMSDLKNAATESVSDQTETESDQMENKICMSDLENAATETESNDRQGKQFGSNCVVDGNRKGPCVDGQQSKFDKTESKSDRAEIRSGRS